MKLLEATAPNTTIEKTRIFMNNCHVLFPPRVEYFQHILIAVDLYEQ
jgi:hypothetical protein